MARMIPPYISPEIKSPGEKFIFELFKNDPDTKGWTVLHSLALSKHTKRLYGEIDFLVLAPGLGIFCLEVKSGDIKREEGIWKLTNKFGETTLTSRGPFQQVQEAMFSLIEAVKRKFGGNSQLSRLLYGYGVMFPHVTFKADGVENEQWQVYDRDSRRQPISYYIRRLSENTKNKIERSQWANRLGFLPEDTDMNTLVSFLRGDFERIISRKDLLDDMERQIEQYTAEQYLCLDQLQENPRCLFQGAAGTGKTMIALESVRRGLFQNQRTLMVCFNRLLGRWLALQFPVQQKNLVVGSFHSFLSRIATDSGTDISSNIDSDKYARIILPLTALEAIDKGIIEPFDKLVIDEGQDLIRPEYLDVFDALLKGGLAGGKWEIYCDFERQAIYEKLSASEMMDMLESRADFVKFKLKVNCRNTRPIAEETAILSGFETPPFLPARMAGPPVEYLFYSNLEDEVNKLENIISELLGQRIRGGKITILSPRRWQNSCVSKLNIKRIHRQHNVIIEELHDNAASLILGDMHGGSGSVTFSTIQSFKGLENSYIILTDISKINDDEFRSILYVGMSRARIGLFVLIDEKARGEYNDIIKRGLKKYERPAN